MEKEVQVKLSGGLQARPAALFVQEANRFKSDIQLVKDHKKANAKSIMGVMSLAVGNGETLIIKADGEDAEDAAEGLAAFVEREN